MTVRLRKDAAVGVYEVFVDDVKVGEVAKVREHFNLRRPITVTSWRADPVGGRPGERLKYPTRRDAVAALVGATS